MSCSQSGEGAIEASEYEVFLLGPGMGGHGMDGCHDGGRFRFPSYLFDCYSRKKSPKVLTCPRLYTLSFLDQLFGIKQLLLGFLGFVLLQYLIVQPAALLAAFGPWPPAPLHCLCATELSARRLDTRKPCNRTIGALSRKKEKVSPHYCFSQYQTLTLALFLRLVHSEASFPGSHGLIWTCIRPLLHSPILRLVLYRGTQLLACSMP